MSGGFFRGTSTDQDTRFSNKQAKLLKSQKFAPELDYLVDMTKVNVEVMKPWITRRVTEVLGFEDEVLINFIHSLLDGKEVNGKEVQIQITGFMEKNTGKFMKELWTLLLSAQKNASGVPQQFLDAKEEELKKKKVENDRITSEIQKKKDKEGREAMQQRLKKMDGGFHTKDPDGASEPALKSRDSGDYILEGKDPDKQNGVKARNRVSRSPYSPAVSTSPHRDSPSRSMSKSFPNSRSYSRHRPRSISTSPETQGHSRSSCSPRRHSSWRSSPHRRPSYSRRRSRSQSHYRSPSPVRHRVHSPFHRRSPSSLRGRRSPSPVRRRKSPSLFRRRRSPSPIRQKRSLSPARRRSPIRRHRSPLPVRQLSPLPLKRRSSPLQSPSPVRQRYRSRTPQHRSPSPFWHRSPVNKRLLGLSARRSPTPNEWSSQSPVQHSSLSQGGRKISGHHRSPVLSSREKDRMQGRSPEARQTFGPLRSLQRDKHCNSLRLKSEGSLSTHVKSPIVSAAQKRRNSASSDDRRSFSPYGSPRRQRGVKLANERSLSPPQKPRHDDLESSEGTEEMYHSRENRDLKSKSLQNESKYSSPVGKLEDLPAKYNNKDELSPKRTADHLSSQTHGRYDKIDLRKKGQEVKSEKSSGRGGHPETLAQLESPIYSERTCESYGINSKKSDENNLTYLNLVKVSDQRCKSEVVHDSVGRCDRVNSSVSHDSGSEESDKHRREDKDKRKHKRSERKVVSSDEDYSYDSEKRKESKRRKREERKLHKEEKHRRREERRRKREERRAKKLKIKGKVDDYTADDDEDERMHFQQSDKKEIELRNKALESLKANRRINTGS